MCLGYRYKQAAFCYEELILSQPTVPLYHLAYADVCVTSSNRPHLIKSEFSRCFSLRSFVCVQFQNQVLYTIGGVENIISARKYYAVTIDLTGGKNTRALLGICLVSSLLYYGNFHRSSLFATDR